MRYLRITLAGYYEKSTLYTLYFRPLRIGPSDAWVTFLQWHDFEPGYDGGIIVVSADNCDTWEWILFLVLLPGRMIMTLLLRLMITMMQQPLSRFENGVVTTPGDRLRSSLA